MVQHVDRDAELLRVTVQRELLELLAGVRVAAGAEQPPELLLEGRVGLLEVGEHVPSAAQAVTALTRFPTAAAAGTELCSTNARTVPQGRLPGPAPRSSRSALAKPSVQTASQRSRAADLRSIRRPLIWLYSRRVP